jgi:hypothetical protein
MTKHLLTLNLSGALILATGLHHASAHGLDHDAQPASVKAEDCAHHEKAEKDGKLITGQNDMMFSFDEELTAAFPEGAKEHEVKMHGGFNEDLETGILYTAIPGYGFCSISPDLKTWTKLGDDERLLDNVHGLVFFVHNGKKLLALAQNSNARVLIVDLEGNVLQQLDAPDGSSFKFEPAKEYYAQEKVHFAPTDATYLDGKIYVVTGYSRGDFVLTLEEKDGTWAWGTVAWGGRFPIQGIFNTAHGIYAHEGEIYVANRQAFQVLRFSKDGKLLEVLSDIPDKSLVCNVAHTGKYFIFCPLKKVGDQASAPIYAHTGQKLVSTIIPGELNIPILNNIHHAWPHTVKGEDGKEQLYILVHGWNKGKYAVLKHQ